jgi:hypothetical protein
MKISGCDTAYSSLSRKERAKGSPTAAYLDGEVVAFLFTAEGEKLKCDWLTATPVTTLGGGALGN